ncbi:MAG: helix-turn-helix transcriptional regulator [Firmicutes bacterium]|nr:helix-turn-helix transcriptional regulator [Bacillota bacterium]
MFSYRKFENLCKEHGMTVRQVSQETGVATSTLSNWKLGRYEPKLDKILSLQRFFNVELEAFVDDDSGTG